MNRIFIQTCLVAFLLLPFLVLALRAIRPKLMPWWAACTIVPLLGWNLALGAAVLCEDPGGGAGRAFALFFGWAYACIWSIPPLIIYGLIQLCWQRYSKRGSSVK